MREKGKPLKEIAEKMGTTKSNISAIERSARKNIEKSRRTLELAKVLKTPLIFEINGRIDLFKVPRLIYEKADLEGIKVRKGGPELLKEIREEANAAIENRKVTGTIKVGITREGEIRIEGEKSN